MPRYASPYQDMKMLNYLERDSSGGRGGGMDLIHPLVEAQQLKDLQENFGTPGTPEVPPTPGTPGEVRADKPFLASLRGFQKINPNGELPADAAGSLNDNVVYAMSAGQPVYYKPGNPGDPGKPAVPGKIGLNDFSKRMALLPYVKMDEEDPDATNKSIREFLTEPDQNKALQYLEFQPKNKKKSITVDDRMVGLLDGTPLEGKVQTGDEYSPQEWDTLMKVGNMSAQAQKEGRLGNSAKLEDEVRRGILITQQQKIKKMQGELDLTNTISDWAKKKGIQTDKSTVAPPEAPKITPTYQSQADFMEDWKHSKVKPGDTVTIGGKQFVVGK